MPTQTRTMDKAIRRWKVAADQGYAKAQFYLGAMYYNGQGLPKSEKEASVWYRKVANQGNAEAQFDL